MADTKLSLLGAAGAYSDADLLYIVQGGVSYKTTWGALHAALTTIIEYPEVANYAALPAAASHSGEIYVVLAAQGTGWLFTLKESGFYRSDGAAWTRLGALPADYFTDSVLYIADDSDPTKVCKFQLSSITTATTRTLTVPDASGTIMLVGDAHKTSHENGGADEISVSGLSGVLADPQPPIIGATGTTAVAGNDARLTDARAPTAHASTHTNGTDDIQNATAIQKGLATAAQITKLDGIATGATANSSDATLLARANHTGTQAAATISDFSSTVLGAKLDDFTAPDDNTDLNASTTKHGLMVKATAPSSGLRNVVAIDNAETVYKNAALFDTTDPAALAAAADDGTAMTAARRDHVHAIPIVGTWAVIQVACSDTTTAITAGNGKVTFRMPFAMTLTAVRASVSTAPTGSTILIDVNETGTTVLSTKLMIDASEKTSTTAATPAVISDSALADDAEITVDFDQVGSTVSGVGVVLTLIGTRA